MQNVLKQKFCMVAFGATSADKQVCVLRNIVSIYPLPKNKQSLSPNTPPSEKQAHCAAPALRDHVEFCIFVLVRVGVGSFGVHHHRDNTNNRRRQDDSFILAAPL